MKSYRNSWAWGWAMLDELRTRKWKWCGHRLKSDKQHFETGAVRDHSPLPRRIWSGSGVRIQSPGIRIRTSDLDDFQNLTGTSLFKVTFVVKFSCSSVQWFLHNAATDRHTNIGHYITSLAEVTSVSNGSNTMLFHTSHNHRFNRAQTLQQHRSNTGQITLHSLKVIYSGQMYRLYDSKCWASLSCGDKNLCISA